MEETRSALSAQRRWLAHQRAPGADPDVVIGVAATFTAQPLEPHLGAHLLALGHVPTITFADYNQIREVCEDPTGTLGELDVLVVLWRLEDLFARGIDRVLDGDPAVVADLCDAAAALGRSVGSAARAASFTMVVSVPPFPRPIGADLADASVSIALARAHAAVCDAFQDGVGDAPVRWADLNAWQLALGVDASHDVVKAMVYHQPWSTPFWDVVGRHLGDLVHRRTNPVPKCVVLDCDNTLWGGVVGEDGLGGIALGSAFPGSAYVEFQKVLKGLKDKGVLLAVASKNNRREVGDVFREHDDMVLRPEDISAWRVNWNAKSQSLQEIAAELNIGIDSLVMIDDSHYELAELANAAPLVQRLQVPDEVGLLPDLLASSGLFRGLQTSAEDRARTAMIRQEAVRNEAAAEMSREEFLASLELVVEYLEVGEQHVGRVAQLTNKTNQFNLTTIRRTEADIRALVASHDHVVRAIRVSDKFGEYGIVGVAIVERSGDEWHLDTLLMSCRVLSRGIESAFLGTLAQEGADEGTKVLTARYVPTQKNGLVADLYPNHGFVETAAGEFRAEIVDVAPSPTFVTVRKVGIRSS